MVNSISLEKQKMNERTNNIIDNGATASFYNGSESDDDDHSTSTGFEGTHTSKSDNEQVKVTTKEEQNVSRWRFILVLVLCIVGAAICTGTFFFVRKESSGEYELSYELFANSIEATLVKEEKNLRIGVRNLGETITVSADKTTDFPFVLVDMFETHAEHARARTKMETLFFCPLIDNSLRTQWEDWSFNNQNWIDKSRAVFVDHIEGPLPDYLPGNITSYIYQRRDGIYPEPSEQDRMSPIWYLSPPPFDPAVVNLDVASKLEFKSILQHAVEARTAAISPIMNVQRFTKLMISDADHLQFHQTIANATSDGVGYDIPHVLYAQPVFAEPKSSVVVGAVMGSLAWDSYLTDLIPEGAEGIVAVVRSTCAENNTFTYELNGPEPTYIGMGDHHEESYNNMVRRIPFLKTENIEEVDANSLCSYFVDLYPSSTFEQAYASKVASIAAATVGATFAIVALIFCIYDHFVNARTRKITEAAARSNAVVNSLFPTAVRDRLLAAGDDKTSKQGLTVMDSQHSSASVNVHKSKPIADLFNDCTIMFADIAGFTAWSSMREPPQVFVLLETIYSQFDEIARRRRVFKVETIGDCYVAACGVPKPNKDHHVVMARFARDCLHSFERMTRELEKQLGPDTGDLGLRIGLHSGSVTAGVLRGDRARFQLFGDSMNTAARIESNGESNKIHCSQETADLLVSSGKGNWLLAREDKIYAKGKGELQTYWIENSRRRGTSVGSRSTGESENQSSNIDADEVIEQTTIVKVNHVQLSDKTLRLVDWNVDVLHRLLKQVVVRRRATLRQHTVKTADELYFTAKVRMPLDEVAEIITLPEFQESHYHKEEDVESVVLDLVVTEQLHKYVLEVATLYNSNPFHNFEHASHVTMSVVKLLSRIVAPQDNMLEDENVKSATTLHDHTYGITSDPLTQFSCVLSALIHDADHSGVPNSTLVKEGHAVAGKYSNKSVAEQNSVDLCWNTLMKDEYAELRHTIYETEAELQRFRQLLVNSVMATDIVDKELKNLRNARWAAAFDETSSDETGADSRVAINRKATIVIEHLIQASDVAHTMQHWHIYRKWNERFFKECYVAYKTGRADVDPSETWYKGEIGFFDFYIVPLAKKLASCGVFGVSSDEYLNYATKNRMEWEARGQEVVSDMIAAAEKDWAENQ